MKTRGDAGFVEGLQQRLFVGGPLVGVARAVGDQARHRTARHGAGGLHQHLQIVAIGKTPQDLADIIAGKGAEVVGWMSAADRVMVAILFNSRLRDMAQAGIRFRPKQRERCNRYASGRKRGESIQVLQFSTEIPV